MIDNKELRDRLAVLCGYEYCDGAWWKVDGLQRTRLDHHPFQDGDITALAAVWPEGWEYSMSSWKGLWYGSATTHDDKSVCAANDDYFIGPTEYDARLHLAVAVLEAMQ